MESLDNYNEFGPTTYKYYGGQGNLHVAIPPHPNNYGSWHGHQEDDGAFPMFPPKDVISLGVIRQQFWVGGVYNATELVFSGLTVKHGGSSSMNGTVHHYMIKIKDIAKFSNFMADMADDAKRAYATSRYQRKLNQLGLYNSPQSYQALFLSTFKEDGVGLFHQTPDGGWEELTIAPNGVSVLPIPCN